MVVVVVMGVDGGGGEGAVVGHVVAVVGISRGGGGRRGEGGRDVRHRAEELVGCGGEHLGASEIALLHRLTGTRGC